MVQIRESFNRRDCCSVDTFLGENRDVLVLLQSKHDTRKINKTEVVAAMSGIPIVCAKVVSWCQNGKTPVNPTETRPQRKARPDFGRNPLK
jgi:hypothetical protein